MSVGDVFVNRLLRFREWCMRGRVRTRLFVLVWSAIAVVPREPDYNMLRAGMGVMVDITGDDEGGFFLIGGYLHSENDLREIWSAMLAAAPKDCAVARQGKRQQH